MQVIEYVPLHPQLDALLTAFNEHCAEWAAGVTLYSVTEKLSMLQRMGIGKATVFPMLLVVRDHIAFGITLTTVEPKNILMA